MKAKIKVRMNETKGKNQIFPQNLTNYLEEATVLRPGGNPPKPFKFTRNQVTNKQLSLVN